MRLFLQSRSTSCRATTQAFALNLSLGLLLTFGAAGLGLRAADATPPAVQKTFDLGAVTITAAGPNVNLSGPGVAVAPNQVLTLFTSVYPATVAAENDNKIAALDLNGLNLTVKASGADAKPVKAKLIWFSITDNLAILKLDAAAGVPMRLETKTAVKENDAVYTLTRTAPDAPAAVTAGTVTAGAAGAPFIIDFGAAQCSDGAPVLNARGQWVGLALPAPVHSQLADAARLTAVLFGTVRKIQTEPADFDVDAGGPLKVQVDIGAALAPPRTVTVQAGADPAVRPTTLRLNAKTGFFEGTLNVPPAPGVIDLPVDESTLPATTKLLFRMDPNCQAARNNNATAKSMFVDNFLNKYIEVELPDRTVKKIYFTAMQHATFTSEGSATVLTTDRRTVKGRLLSKFSYSVGTVKLSCGTEQILYIEVPDAKTVESKTKLVLKVAGTTADGTPLAPFEMILK